MARNKLSDSDIQARVGQEIADSLLYERTELSEKRSRALQYYYGEMPDTPPPPNRSSVVSRDVSDTIDKMLPPIIRTFTAGGRIVEYEPQEPGDERFAEQASDYVSYVFMRDNDGYRVLYNATHDALLQGNGIVKHYWEDKPEYHEEEYSGLDEMTMTALLQDPELEVTEQEVEETPMGPMYSLEVRRLKSKGKICIEAIPPEDFLIDADATTLEDFRFVAHRSQVTRSDLIEWGFKRSDVEGLGSSSSDIESEEKLARDGEWTNRSGLRDDATTLVDLYECYVKIDVNDDGIAETVQAYYAGDAAGAGVLLDWDEWDGDLPFTDIPCEPVPHRWDAQSIAEKIFDIQQIKTTMLRAALDNQYAVNNPQPIVVEGAVVNKDSITNPKYGQPVIVRKGLDKPIEYRDMPYVGDKIFGVLEYLDKIIVERTGTSNNAMALDPETLQNQSATAAQLQHDLSYSRAELLARNMAELGWKKVFRKILRIIVKHQDKPRTIRLRNEWVPMDPRGWNAEMDCVVNVGLGTGSRDRDMAMLGAIAMSQKEIIASSVQFEMPQLALEMLPKLVKTLVKQGEAAGVRNADDYFPEFTPEKMQAMMQLAMQQKPDPKVEAEKAKIQAQIQGKQAEMQLEGQKMQMQAQNDAAKAQADAQLAREKAEADIMLKREQLTAEMALKREQLQAELILQREQMAAELQIKRELGMYNANVNGMTKVATSGVHVGGEPG
jgi:hypothetical protein